eukprot:3259268-Rhodomonas_salina.3
MLGRGPGPVCSSPIQGSGLGFLLSYLASLQRPIRRQSCCPGVVVFVRLKSLHGARASAVGVTVLRERSEAWSLSALVQVQGSHGQGRLRRWFKVPTVTESPSPCAISVCP